MLPNIDYRDLPRAAQRLMARRQTDEAMTLPRRSFLKLAGAGGLALGGSRPAPPARLPPCTSHE